MLYLINWAQNWVNSESWRVVATFAILLLCIVVTKLWARVVDRARAERRTSPEVMRARLVWSKNLVWTIGTLCVIAIWASKLAGFAFSVAALAGAILIVSKEVLTCVLGYFLITVSRPYKIGHMVEIGGKSGRVVDIDVFFTTLTEAGMAGQLTGNTIALPNSLTLSTPIRNLSKTGDFLINLYKIVLPFNCDIERAEACALAAADQVSLPWQTQADAHLKAIEASVYIDLPSSRPKVYWQAADSKSQELVVRFACPPSSRIAAEQEIFKKFWAGYKQASKAESSPELD